MTPASDIDKARELFQEAGLPFPSIPDELAAQLKEQREWLFSTREVKVSPYNLQYYVQEFESTHVQDYALLGHAGHGTNSYAVEYYVVRRSFGMFLHLAWGGIYSDANADAAQIRECFLLADQIVAGAQAVGNVWGDDRLTVVGSSFYGSHASLLDKDRDEGHKWVRRPPTEVLTEVLRWLGR